MGIKERKEREKERRRQQIIVAAKKIFSEQGFNKATMEDIAREAELSPGTIYLYFKNKEDLYASLSLRILQYLNMRVEHVNKDKKLGPKEKVKALIEVMYDVYDFDPLTIISVFHLQSSETLRNISPQLKGEIEELSGKSIAGISNIFDQGTKEGIFIAKHPVALADILWGCFTGVILWESSKNIINEEKDYIRKTLETGFEVFYRGLMK